MIVSVALNGTHTIGVSRNAPVRSVTAIWSYQSAKFLSPSAYRPDSSERS